MILHARVYYNSDMSIKKAAAKAEEKPSKIKLALCALVAALLAVVVTIISLLIGSIAPTQKFTYRELVGTIDNPGVGYTKTDWYHIGSGTVHDTKGAIVLFFVDLSTYSSELNGTGEDRDLDGEFFKNLRGTFENCRNNGSTIAMRFRYDENGKQNPEPKTFQKVLDHIAQIKNDGVMEEYKDILMFVESGFVGMWGEQQGGKYTSVEYKAKLLEAVLDMVPAPVPVTVRTPDIFAKYVGIPRSELASYECKNDTERRVGLYDDGYMGSKSDLGTYANREIETEWLGKQTLTSYFGGEFSGDIKFAVSEGQYVPEKAIPEMYKTHLSYINGNIFQLYKDYKFSKKYDVDFINNSAYYGQTVWQFIRDHLGYRFVLEESRIDKRVSQGGQLNLSFTLINKGFANPVKKQKCEIILEKDGAFTTCEVDLDPTKWYSGERVENKLHLKIPAFLEKGKWNIYFKSSIGNDGLEQFNMRSIRFANKNVWSEIYGANLLGSFEVTAAKGKAKTQNSFYEVGTESAGGANGAEGASTAQAHLYNLSAKVTVDGKLSTPYEWNEADVVAEENGHKIYARFDENFMYLYCDMPHKSVAPVFNVRAKTDKSDKTFWLYVSSGGFVYFSNDGETGHTGLELKYTDGAFEYKIPLYMFALANGGKVTSLNAFIQDSQDGWKKTGGVATETEFEVRRDFTVYNCLEKVTLLKGGSYTLTVKCNAEIAGVQWFKDGEEIAGMNGATLTLTNLSATDGGEYSVKITTVKGTEKVVKLAEIRVI